MTYTIAGLPHESFTPYFAMNEPELAAVGARRVVADADSGFPCRVTLQDAPSGENLILLNYVSHDVTGPFRTAYAIYVSEGGRAPEPFVDALPASLASRALSLRAFDAEGMIVTASLVAPGEADFAIPLLFADSRVAYIMAHFAAYGCFAARIARSGGPLGDKA